MSKKASPSSPCESQDEQIKKSTLSQSKEVVKEEVKNQSQTDFKSEGGQSNYR